MFGLILCRRSHRQLVASGNWVVWTWTKIYWNTFQKKWGAKIVHNVALDFNVYDYVLHSWSSFAINSFVYVRIDISHTLHTRMCWKIRSNSLISKLFLFVAVINVMRWVYPQSMCFVMKHVTMMHVKYCMRSAWLFLATADWGLHWDYSVLHEKQRDWVLTRYYSRTDQTLHTQCCWQPPATASCVPPEHEMSQGSVDRGESGLKTLICKHAYMYTHKHIHNKK